LFLFSRIFLRDKVLNQQIPLKIFTPDNRAAADHLPRWWVKCIEFGEDYVI
jgi:hypothetical protein